jgi:hypothetical protein
MNFRDREKMRAPELIHDIIGGEGNGLYRKKRYPFVLQERTDNLWNKIRQDALEYFEEYDIAWWSDDNRNIPTGHVLSSQVACVNHLFWLRDRKDAALAVIQAINSEFVNVAVLDTGYVEFEVIGRDNYLGERSHQRGANATSLDAAMVGVKENGVKVFIAIEWKYTEYYGKKNKYIPARSKIYDPLIDEAGSPIRVTDKSSLYYEPFYQLMRQTLLAHKIAIANDYGCTDYTHIHVIPRGNSELLNSNKSPGLEGISMKDAWKGALCDPGKYNIIDPEDFIAGAKGLPGTDLILHYLSSRYWC